MKPFEVVDGLFDQEYCEQLEKEFLQQSFKWALSKSLYTAPAKNTQQYDLENVNEYLLFVHDFHRRLKDETIVESSYCSLISPILDTIVKYNKLKCLNIYRSKANLQTQYTKNKSEYFNTPHRDLDIKHKVALYYVNDSDGDTILFDNHNNVMKRVTPKKGRILFFDGDILHTSSHPVNTMYRMCVNIDYDDRC